jgi:hypothetical protein
MFTPGLKTDTLKTGVIASREKEGRATGAHGARNPWKRLREGFIALMKKEQRILRLGGAKDCCYAYIAGDGGWVEGSPTERVQSQFELLATEAGLALGCPSRTLPLTKWIQSLYHDLRANGSKFIHISNDSAAFIESLSEASAIYCARLDRRWIEKTVTSSGEVEAFDGQQASALLALANSRPHPEAPDTPTSDEERSVAIARYTNHWTCSEAALARAARVDPADLSKWKKGRLPAESDKCARIDRALSENHEPVPAAKRSPDDV